MDQLLHSLQVAFANLAISRFVIIICCYCYFQQWLFVTGQVTIISAAERILYSILKLRMSNFSLSNLTLCSEKRYCIFLSNFIVIVFLHQYYFWVFEKSEFDSWLCFSCIFFSFGAIRTLARVQAGPHNCRKMTVRFFSIIYHPMLPVKYPLS